MRPPVLNTKEIDELIIWLYSQRPKLTCINERQETIEKFDYYTDKINYWEKAKSQTIFEETQQISNNPGEM